MCIYIYHHSFGMKLIDLNYRWQLAAFGGISCWSAIAYPSADPLLIAPLLSGRWKYPYTNGWKFPINSSKPHQVTAIPKVSFVYGCISYIISNPIHPSVTLVQNPSKRRTWVAFHLHHPLEISQVDEGYEPPQHPRDGVWIQLTLSCSLMIWLICVCNVSDIFCHLRNKIKAEISPPFPPSTSLKCRSLFSRPCTWAAETLGAAHSRSITLLSEMIGGHKAVLSRSKSWECDMT